MNEKYDELECNNSSNALLFILIFFCLNKRRSIIVPCSHFMLWKREIVVKWPTDTNCTGCFKWILCVCFFCMCLCVYFYRSHTFHTNNTVHCFVAFQLVYVGFVDARSVVVTFSKHNSNLSKSPTNCDKVYYVSA